MTNKKFQSICITVKNISNIFSTPSEYAIEIQIQSKYPLATQQGVLARFCNVQRQCELFIFNPCNCGENVQVVKVESFVSYIDKGYGRTGVDLECQISVSISAETYQLSNGIRRWHLLQLLAAGADSRFVIAAVRKMIRFSTPKALLLPVTATVSHDFGRQKRNDSGWPYPDAHRICMFKRVSPNLSGNRLEIR